MTLTDGHDFGGLISGLWCCRVPCSRSLGFVVLMVSLSWLAGGANGAILDPMTQMRDDVSRIKVMMESVGEQLERFNGLYLNKLENRLLTSATSLAHIDSNVKNIQERAHVWDTFQLHVSAWNEQIKSLDKKLDILSRGTEKFEMLDEKVAALMPLEYKLEKLMERLEETDTKVSDIQRKINLAPPPTATSAPPPAGSEAPLFSEFTSRGVLSALKDIEIKVNKLVETCSSQKSISVPAVSKQPESCVNEYGKKTYELVNDVAGKVDFIVDKFVVKRPNKADEAVEDNVYDDTNDDYSTGNLSANNNAGDLAGANQAERAFVKLWRRMLQPVRRANRRFENLDKVLLNLDKLINASLQVNSRDARGHQVTAMQEDVTSVLQCCRANDVGVRAVARSIEVLSDNFNVQMGERCVREVDLQHRLQLSKMDTIQQVRETVREAMNVTLDRVDERLRQSCLHSGKLNQRKKGRDNVTTSGDEAWTEATNVGASVESPEERRTSEETVEEPPVKVIRGCQDLRMAGETESRIYSLASGKELNEGGRDYNTRFCDMTTDGGGWTIIQRRGDFDLPRENFSVGWREYKLGFGRLDREFWFGNDFIHRLTNENDVVLRVELWDFNDTYVYADYESFRVDSEEDLYRLWVEGYQGNATDSLGSHNGYAFSTYDRDNDEAPPCCPCAPAYGGGWWFYSCFEANLNGEYHTNPTDNDYFRGIIWELWRGDYSLRRTEMKIRPQGFHPPATVSPPTVTPELEQPLGDDLAEDP